MFGAMAWASIDIVLMLLNAGANVKCIDMMGNDAFMYASVYGRPKNLQCWLERVKEYDLEHRNAALGVTSLIIAVNMGANKVDTVRTLCESGARIDALSHPGFSVLMAACANEDSDPAVVKLLIEVLDRVEDLGLDLSLIHI